ncbi:nucleotide exchange factor GrpE [Candidatus Woesebacteria bacterium GWC2_33_12]|uniref:Protein GrpE n=1 Tax=Candidatus Woesebacteria bacterium GW2011_GWB1_33_22 TaxID=1618566 RepID=A0A0F9ZJ61_9BACT|nr:MAG: Protein GrpE [Candidatus Woesebacteria bacterium GW2011_GWC2_33_12]KKP41741.1 MAG: Protein GrpE [Candidatus Woesebacteria bacterium GW2011_GWA2_33_20]KKP44124.1 MAG: Protein GrpE [Candidatus Woesebacteria bacterium GW2011_GWB1_33_22]KKP45783.1 MAG: Protein GrpE [Microgenomates group bacterium GW2011_GWC1_33_28]KKP50206.1 MAG: Protein GrpE [Candidatus Woesebacteria bacterium GW2011_GWA1_33_33]OGM07358.1 MAG: nucleotide exchange factor GrpE [Candidatus Woesebacteria bacterium GWC2_33_12]
MKKKANSQQPIANGQIVLKEQLARAMADYANLQKRTDEERVEMFKLASVSFMSKILPIIDNLKSAQNHIKDSGIAMIIGQLETLAHEEGFEEIKINVGDKFDEATSEVIETIETLEEKDNNNVSEVVMPGWKYSDGTVVRHARVKVAKTK